MVSVIQRMRKLRGKVKDTRTDMPRPQDTRPAILWIRNGPGAIQLPKEVTKISVDFHKKLIGSQHRGARHFWHDILPRIKYRNPSVPISVTRHLDPNGPAYLHIFTAPPAAQTSATPTTTTTPDVAAVEAADQKPTHTIEIKDLHESEILEALVEKTGALVLSTPPEEAEEMAELEQQKERSEVDRVMVRERLTRERRDAELLKIARGEISARD